MHAAQCSASSREGTSMIENPPMTAFDSGEGPAHSPRALTIDETTHLRTRLRADQRAVDLDLPDLVDCMLLTGVRIGEACAIRDEVVDAEAGVVEITPRSSE